MRIYHRLLKISIISSLIGNLCTKWSSDKLTLYNCMLFQLFRLCFKRFDSFQIGFFYGRNLVARRPWWSLWRCTVKAFGCPLTKACSNHRTDTIAEGDNHIEVVEWNISTNHSITLLLNLSEFSTSWIWLQFSFVVKFQLSPYLPGANGRCEAQMVQATWQLRAQEA